MNQLIRSFLLALASWLTLFPALVQAAPRAADQAFQFTAALASDHGLGLQWIIAPGYYLYHDRFAVMTADGHALPVMIEAGEQKDDPTFGPVEIHRDTARVRVAADDLPASGSVVVSYQGCAEKGVCLPPVRSTVDLAILGGDETAAPVARAKAPGALKAILRANLALLFAGFFGFGLLLSLTPCVFPMIPILSAVIAGGRAEPRRALALSGAYVLAMAAAYATVGIAAAWTGQNLQLVLQTPAAVMAMSLLFAVLALSMFGLFELQLPGVWSQKVARVTSGAGGSLPGAALLGFGSALIVGPCVTPPLAAALLYVADTGDLLRGALALFALGLGMGLPLIAFGVIGAGLMPKSGPWLAKAKQSFGFVFLALAIWMSGRVIDERLIRIAWFALSLGLILWLGLSFARRRLTVPSWSGGRIAIGFAIVAALLSAAGAAALSMVPALPSVEVAARSKDGFARTVTSTADFDAAVAAARLAKRPILVDFTAAWCAACREIEADVLEDTEIRARLKHVSVIRADMTAFSQESQTLMQRFGVVGPPTMLFLSPEDGREIDAARSIGAITLSEFRTLLDRAGA